MISLKQYRVNIHKIKILQLTPTRIIFTKIRRIKIFKKMMKLLIVTKKVCFSKIRIITKSIDYCFSMDKMINNHNYHILMSNNNLLLYHKGIFKVQYFQGK